MPFGKKKNNSNNSSKKQNLRSLSLNDLHPEETEQDIAPKIPESYIQEEFEAFGEASKVIKQSKQTFFKQENHEEIKKQKLPFQETFPQQTSPMFQLQKLDSSNRQKNVDSSSKREKKKLFGRKRQQKRLVEEQDEMFSNSYYEDGSQEPSMLLQHEDEIDTSFNLNSLETVSKKAKKHKSGRKKRETKDKQRKISKNQERAMQQAANADVTGFDPARMIELPEWDLPPWARKVFFGIVIVAVIIGLFVFGYFETDFNTDGDPQIVSIETRNERMYVNKSDELLQEIIDCASYIEENTSDMSDYITISAEIQKQYDSLNANTTKLSKYTNVPTSMETYHTKLLNVSLGVQKLQTEILQNYQNSDYSDWRTSNIASMDSSLDTLHDMRFQIDERIWGDSQ